MTPRWFCWHSWGPIRIVDRGAAYHGRYIGREQRCLKCGKWRRI